MLCGLWYARLRICVKYVSGVRCPDLLHLTLFFVSLFFSYYPSFILFHFVFFCLFDCNQPRFLQSNGDGDASLPPIGWNQQNIISLPLIALAFHFTVLNSSIKRSNSGQLAWTPLQQKTNKQNNDTPHLVITHFHWHIKLNTERKCVDVLVKVSVMCLAVCESGRCWVVGLCLGCVCVGWWQQDGRSKGGAWMSKPLTKRPSRFFSLLTRQRSFSSCVSTIIHIYGMVFQSQPVVTLQYIAFHLFSACFSFILLHKLTYSLICKHSSLILWSPLRTTALNLIILVHTPNFLFIYLSLEIFN